MAKEKKSNEEKDIAIKGMQQMMDNMDRLN